MNKETRKKLVQILKELTEAEKDALLELLTDKAGPSYPGSEMGRGVQISEINYEGHGW